MLQRLGQARRKEKKIQGTIINLKYYPKVNLSQKCKEYLKRYNSGTIEHEE